VEKQRATEFRDSIARDMWEKYVEEGEEDEVEMEDDEMGN
jgi:hypothetical protein